MRVRPFAALLLVASGVATTAGAATRIDDPLKFVAQVYASLHRNPGFKPPDDIYTPRLAALFAANRSETGTAPPNFGRLDFSFWYDAQDTDDGAPGQIQVKAEDVWKAPDRELIVATFTNYSAKENHFYFEKTPAGWKLDDVSSASDAWTLSLILKYGR